MPPQKIKKFDYGDMDDDSDEVEEVETIEDEEDMPVRPKASQREQPIRKEIQRREVHEEPSQPQVVQIPRVVSKEDMFNIIFDEIQQLKQLIKEK